MGQAQLCRVQARQGDALKAAREKGISGKGWQSRAKSHMLGCLDIDFCEWDAADIARQWRRLMRQEAGGRLPFSMANLHCFGFFLSDGTSWSLLLHRHGTPS